MLKNVLIGLLLIASLIAPSILTGVLIVAIISAAVCSLDVALERAGRELSQTHRFPSYNLKMPASFCVVGMIMTLVFIGVGFGWGLDPGFSNRSVELFGTCVSIAAHICTLLAFVVSIQSLACLGDLS